MSDQAKCSSTGAGQESDAHVRHREAMNELDDVANSLISIRNAAWALGLERLDRQMKNAIDFIGIAVEKAKAAYADEFNEHIRTTEQGTVNMIGACMAVDKLRSGA